MRTDITFSVLDFVNNLVRYFRVKWEDSMAVELFLHLLKVPINLSKNVMQFLIRILKFIAGPKFWVHHKEKEKIFGNMEGMQVLVMIDCMVY